MRLRIRDYLELIRVPNGFTAMADILGGYLFAGGRIEDLRWIVPSLASFCLYSGGVALNDVCDSNQDTSERPGRPIPSGRISRRAAGLCSATLLVVGLPAAGSSNAQCILPAAALVLTIVLYNAVFKNTVIAPALMGLCRALNLSLGMGIVKELNGAAVVPAALIWLYVSSVTYFARHETRVNQRGPLIGGTVGVCLAILTLLLVPLLFTLRRWEFVALQIPLFLIVAHRGFRAIQTPQPKLIQQAVKTFVIGIVGFDACLAAMSQGLMPGLFVLLLLIPTILLGRVFRVT